MFFKSSNKSVFSEIERKFQNVNSVVVYWSGIPYDSSIIFMSKKIDGLEYSVDEYTKDPKLLFNIRSPFDQKQLAKKIEYVKDKTAENFYEYELTFSVKTGKKDSWIKESTKVFVDNDAGIFSESIFINVSKEMTANFFIKEAANDADNAYSFVSIKKNDNYELSAQNIKNMDLFMELQNNVLKDRMAFGCFYDMSSTRISEYEGSEQIFEYCSEVIGIGELNNFTKIAHERAAENGENYIFDYGKHSIKCLSMPLYFKEKLFGTWNIIYSENYIDDLDEFHRSLDIIQQRMTAYLQVYLDAIIDKKRKSDLENNLVEEINRNDVFHFIINLLENDEDLSSSADGILVEIGNTMHLTNAFILEVPNSNNDSLNVIGEWCASKDVSYVEKYKEFFLENYKNPLISGRQMDDIMIASESDEPSNLRDFIEEIGASALMAVPIFSSNSELTMCAVFVDDKPGRIWDISDISFVSNICSVIENMLYKVNSKKKLQSSYAALKEILDNMGCMVYVSDKETDRILFCNSEVRETLRSDITNKYCRDIEKIAAFMAGESEIHDKNTGNWYAVNKNEITWIDGSTVNLWVVMDITKKKNYEEKIERQAKFDSLTGLSNRISGEKELERVVLECKLDTKKSAALLFIDLDNFKDINDGLGHEYGDSLLRMVSMGMNQIKGVEGKCYRFGGDEFIIIVSPEHIDRLEVIVDEMLKMFNKPWSLTGVEGSLEGIYEYYCTMSMGIVRINHESRNANEVIKNADIAMYEAKKTGKNGYKIFNSLEPNEISMRLDMEKTMRNAISKNCEEFKVYFQPIIDAETGEIKSCESLVRWDSAEKGFIMPGDFIGIAEHIGTIYDIGEHILRQACLINRQWEKEGYTISTNVNVSMMQIMQSDVVDKIKNILDETGVNKNNIILEITENIAASDVEKTAVVISKIRDLGVRIALDDFGTGYSSLSYIKMLKPDIIKVDRVFTNDIETDPYSKTFIRMIIEIAKVLEVRVCVEGVETVEQYRILKELGTSHMQGFLFGKAVEPNEFKENFLNKTVDVNFSNNETEKPGQKVENA